MNDRQTRLIVDQPSVSGTRFGIKFKLFAAFLGLVALTAIAGLVALVVFDETDRAIHHLADDSLPEMVAALRLAEKSAEIAAAAPTIASSSSQAEREDAKASVDTRQQQLVDLTEGLTMLRSDDGMAGRLGDAGERMSAELNRLNDAVANQLDLRAERATAVKALWDTHERFLNVLEPMVDDAVFDLVISGETVTGGTGAAITELVDVGASRLEQLLTINAEGNLAAGLMAEAVQLDDPSAIAPIFDRFVAASDAIERSLEAVAGDADVDELRRATGTLLAFGRGASSVFTGNTSEPAGLAAAHDAFLNVLVHLIDDAAFDLVLDTERTAEDSAGAVSTLIDTGARSLQALLTLRAEGNLLAGLLAEAAAAPGANLMAPLEDRYTAVSLELRGLLDEPAITVAGETTGQPPGGPRALDTLRQTTEDLVAFGSGSGGMFELRGNELAYGEAAKAALAASRQLADELQADVNEVVVSSQAAGAAAAARSNRIAEIGWQVMVALTVASLIVALAVMVFYIGRRILAPLERITGAMTGLAGGDTTIDIPYRERKDEIGRMARELGIFRDAVVEVQESNLAEIREGRRRLSDAIESISEGFSLYDAQDRLLVCNRRYWAILHDDEADAIAPGMTFEEVLRKSAESGRIQPPDQDLESWIEDRLARHRNPGAPYAYQRGDGRWILVSERKTQEGGTVAVYSDITELKEREEELARKTEALQTLSNQLSKYLSPQVYESIFTGKQEVKVTSQRKKLTVFFSDIANFTETTDRLESEALTHLLNHYLTEMAEIALAHGATIDKYVGDAILIFFGDPETRGVEADALACVSMAIAMRNRMRELETFWRDSGVEKPLRCRMGINSGYCTVGNFGSEDRMDYTIIGGGVNLAARLETAAAPGEILISYETYAHVKNHVACEAREPIEVKGIPYPVSTYQVIDPINPEAVEDRSAVEDHLKDLDRDLRSGKLTAEERSRAAAALRAAADRMGGD